MAISIVGSITETHSTNATSVSLVNTVHTTTSDTSLLLLCAAVEGNENPDPTAPALFDIGGTDQAMTLISDSGNTGSNGDVRTLIYGLVSPGAVTDANVRFDIEFSANPIVTVWVNISGVVTTSVAAATNDLETVSNTVAGSTTAFSSAGSTGNGLLVFAAAQGNDMNPSAPSGSFTEQVEGVTAATTDDLAYNVSTLLSGAPSACTITWNTTDQNAGCFIELIPAASSGFLPGYKGSGRGVMRGVMRGT